ncbi:MAG: methyltransferase domain-containing protein [Thermoleophilaceae bacterium]
MLEDVVALLRCPHCAGDLSLADRTARCAAGHSFDVARQGYLNLLPGDAQPGTADTAAMVDARHRFLSTGHYAPIADAVAVAAQAAVLHAADPRPAILDVGAGTGHHLATTLDRIPTARGLALDISKHALRRAARAHPRLAAIGADAWRPLPLKSSAATAILTVFSPRNPAEIHRILQPSGALVLATPTPTHLQEVIAALGLLKVDPQKQQRLDDRLAELDIAAETTVEHRLTLTHDDLAALTAMGPSSHHVDPATVNQRIADLPQPFPATASVRVATYRPS